MNDIAFLEKKAYDLRKKVLDTCIRAKTGHVTSSMSCAEIMSVLYHGGILRYDPKRPDWPDRDRFILSKGQASPMLYAVLADAGYFDEAQLKGFAQTDGKFGVHLQQSVPGAEITCGSLGQGFGFAAGMVPGLVEIGFRGRDAVPRATVAAGVLLAAHVALHCSGVSPAWLAPFRAGMGFLGAFVYLLGLLILASRRYSQYGGKPSNLWTRYASMQAVTVVSGLATIYFGSVHGVDNLLGLGGTFFCLFLLEKYYDLPWRGIGWAWSLLGAGGLLYLFALLVQARPAWFFFMR